MIGACRRTGDYGLFGRGGRSRGRRRYRFARRARIVQTVYHALNVLITFLFIYGKRFHERVFHARIYVDAELGRAFDRFFAHHHAYGFGRKLSRHGVVNGHAERVNVRPRTLFAVRVVLLGRSKPLFQNDRQRFSVGVGIFGCAEIDELDFVELGYKDIVGRNIAVDKPDLVYLSKRVHNRAHYGKHFVRAYLAAAALQILFERHAVEEFHYNIRRSVSRKEVANIDDTGKIFYLCKRARFFHEPFQSAVACGLVLLGIDYYLIVACDARHVSGREVFFKRDFNTLLKIPSKVCDAETALAERFAHEISVLRTDHRALGQVMGRRRRIVGFVMTVCTHSVGIEIAEAVQTDVFISSYSCHFKVSCP